MASQQYLFAHRALPARFYRDPTEFIELVENDDEDLSIMWELAGEEAGVDAGQALGAVGTTLSKGPFGGTLVFVEIPVAIERGDAIYVALVPPLSKQAPRYITLEKAGRGTMLCEWEQSGRHRNYGEGPEPHLTAFQQAVVKLLGPSAEDAFKEIVAGQLGAPLDSLVPQASFIDDLGADPLDIDEMFEALAARLHVPLPAGFDRNAINTVGDALDYIRDNLT